MTTIHICLSFPPSTPSEARPIHLIPDVDALLRVLEITALVMPTLPASPDESGSAPQPTWAEAWPTATSQRYQVGPGALWGVHSSEQVLSVPVWRVRGARRGTRCIR